MSGGAESQERRKMQTAVKLFAIISIAAIALITVAAVVLLATRSTATGSASYNGGAGLLFLIPYMLFFYMLSLGPLVLSESLGTATPVKPGLATLRGLLDLYYRGLISRETFLAHLRKISGSVAITSERMDPNDPLAKWAVLIAMWRRKLLTDGELVEKIEALRNEWG